MNDIPLSALHAREFAGLKGRVFGVNQGTRKLAELELVDVFVPKEITPGWERFSLSFRGPLEPALTQGTYQFEQEELGRFDLFISPVKRDREMLAYEAIFNRILRIE